MKKGILILFIVLLLRGYDLNYTCAKEGIRNHAYLSFHKPETDAEKKLDYIVRYKDSDIEREELQRLWPEMRKYIEQWPHTKPEMKLQYKNLFTKDFIYAWSRLERKRIEESSGENYVDGCPFGKSFYVLNCSDNEFGGEYLYRTIEETEDYAIVQYIPVGEIEQEKLKNNEPINKPGYATYKLIKYGNMWLLEGLICELTRLNINFNFQKPPLKEADSEFNWHIATSQAEKKLEALINWCDFDIYNREESTDKSWIDIKNYIEKWPHTKPELPLRYTDLFTKEFIYAWSELEKNTVDKECDGRYIEGEKCGKDLHPFGDYCLNDNDVYVYRTLEKGEDYIVIQVGCERACQKRNTKDDDIYRMVKQGDEWVVDAVAHESDSELTFNLNY